MRGTRPGFDVTGPGGELAACPQGRGWCQFRAVPSGAGGGWVQLEQGNKCFPRVSLSWRLRGGEPLGGAAGPPLSPVLGERPGSGNLLQWVGGTGHRDSCVLGELGPGTLLYWGGEAVPNTGGGLGPTPLHGGNCPALSLLLPLHTCLGRGQRAQALPPAPPPSVPCCCPPDIYSEAGGGGHWSQPVSEEGPCMGVVSLWGPGGGQWGRKASW